MPVVLATYLLTFGTQMPVTYAGNILYMYLYSAGPVTALNEPERECVYNVPEN